MKKKLLLLAIYFIFALQLKAQMNLDFNMGTLYMPSGNQEFFLWSSTNILIPDGAPTTISSGNSSTGASMHYSAVLETVHCPTCPSLSNSTFPNLTDTLKAVMYQAFEVEDELPTSFSVTYRTSMQGNDLPAFRLRAWKWENNSRVYYGEKIEVFPVSSTWTVHQFDMDYFAGIAVPVDSFEIAMTSSAKSFLPSAPSPTIGSIFSIDMIDMDVFDLSLGQIPLAACNADSNLINQGNGFWPDSATNLPVANYDDYYYSSSVQLKTIKDTVIEVFMIDTIRLNLSISRQRLDEVEGLPNGFIVSPNYNTSNSNWLNSGTSTNFNSEYVCIDLFAFEDDVQNAYYGPNTSGVYPLNFKFSYLVDSYQCLSGCSSPFLSGVADQYVGNWVHTFSATNVVDSTYSFLELRIDNSNPVSCNSTVQIDSVEVYFDSAFVMWSQSGNVNHWNLHITENGNALGTGQDFTNVGNSFLFANLINAQSYDFYIQGNCGGSQVGAWQGPFNFVTNFANPPAGACNVSGSFFGNNFLLTPDSATNLNIANKLEPFYQQNIELNTPNETNFTSQLIPGFQSDIEMKISKVRLVDVVGLPQGFSYTPNYPNNQNEWMNIDTLSNYLSTQGCIDLYGSQSAMENAFNGGPNNDGVYPLEFVFEFFAEDAQCLANCGTNNMVQTMVTSIFDNKWVKLGDFNSDLRVTYFNLIVDSIPIIAPMCYQPFNLTANNITDSTANIAWGSNGDEIAWVVEYGLEGFTQGTGQFLSSSNDSLFLNNLTDTSTYEVYIRAACALDSSQWSGPFQFTTMASQCPSITSVTFNNITDSSARIQAPTSSFMLEVEYGVTGFTQGTGTLTSISTFSLSTLLDNLNSSTTYDVYTRTNCTGLGMGMSNWSGPHTFTTLGTPQCVAPSNFYSFHLGDSITVLNWENNPLVSAWNFEYGPTGFTQGSGQLVNTTDTTYQILNLDTNFTYDIYIQAICSGTPTAWSNVFNFAPPFPNTPPPCNVPTNINFTNVLDVQLNLNWSNSSSNNVEVEYGLAGFSQGSGTIITASGNSAFVDNLDPNTSYDFYVRAICNSGVSAWSNVYNVSTSQVLSGPCLDAHSFNVAHGFNSATLSWSGYGNELSWWVDVGPVGFTQGNGQLLNPTDTFVDILGVDSSQVYDFYILSFCHNDTTAWIGPFDLFGNGVTVITPCDEPQNITTLAVTDSSASFSWMLGGNETQWEVEYGNAGFNLGQGSNFSVNQTSFITNNLDTNTTYDFYFRSICTADSSSWVGPLSLTTDTLAIIPPGNISANNVGVNSATVSWANDPNVALWYVQYGHQGSFDFRRSSIVYDSTYVPEYTFTNLDSGYIYEAFVKSKYLNGKVSEWSDPVVFNTFGPNFTKNDKVFDYLNIYPNPTNNITHLNMILSQSNTVKISIFNTAGQLVYQEDLGNISAGVHDVKFDVSGYVSGVYFFQIMANDGMITKKISIIK